MITTVADVGSKAPLDDEDSIIDDGVNIFTRNELFHSKSVEVEEIMFHVD